MAAKLEVSTRTVYRDVADLMAQRVPIMGKAGLGYANTPNVIFGIMNEPHNQSAAQWEPIAQDSINAIRAAGATSQAILIPGTYWQNAKD